MIPTVAIVGRPNTGKSTLFNRLIGRKSAITYDESGTTRDRVFGHATISGKPVILVDTGGLEVSSEDDMESDIRKQSLLAIEQADVVVFVVDMTEELTASDFGAAQVLRETDKPVILVASKCDSGKMTEKFYNIYELGFGDPVKLSAIHAMGIDELGSRLKKEMADLDLDFADSDKFEDRITLSFVGRPNAGKSSLVNSLLGKDQVIVSDKPGTTRDSVTLPFDYEDDGFVFIDTAGIRKSGKRRGEWLEKFTFMRSLQSIEMSDVVVLVLDAEAGLGKQDMRVSQFALEAKKGLIIVLNKADLVKPEEKNKLLSVMTRRMAYAHFAPVIFTSAKTGKNVLEILAQAKRIDAERKKMVKTRELNYFLERIVAKHPPPAGIKFKFIEQVGTEPPHFLMFANKPEKVHFSYKRYLDNEIRNEFGFGGTAMTLSFKHK